MSAALFGRTSVTRLALHYSTAVYIVDFHGWGQITFVCLRRRFVAPSAMQQRWIDFEQVHEQAVRELASVPTTQPRLDLTFLRPLPSLVRPERQFTYGGAAHDDWPPPERNPNTLTVDRLRTDIDGPAHRFVIQRGDLVEVFIPPDQIEVGKVVDLDHDDQAARVSFGGKHRGKWFPKEQIYPTPPGRHVRRLAAAQRKRQPI